MLLIALNAFKNSLGAFETSHLIASELAGNNFPIRILPMGDGGDGTAEILAFYLHASSVEVSACDALGRPYTSRYYECGDTAIIELAAICGLKSLQPSEYNVMAANTAGLGIAICDAVKRGRKKILLCIGGSASVDGGTGALEIMGLQIFRNNSDYKNHVIHIQDINTNYLKEKFNDIEITILCDVDNPLCGTMGAANIFAPQKGASPMQVDLLDQQLARWAEILLRHTDNDVKNIRHGGAAGGIAASFSALLQAKLLPGSEYCLQLSGFDTLLPHARWVITGEGRIDRQSLYGKIPGVIAERCHKKQIKVIGICGQAEKGLTTFDRIFALTDYAPSIEAAIRNPQLYFQPLCGDLKEYLLSDL